MHLHLKEIDPLSCGKILAVVYLGLSLIFVPCFLLLMIIAPNLPSTPDAPNPAHLLVGMGLVFAVLIPVIYTTVGFIGGLLLAVIYNLAAKLTGGLSLTFVEAKPTLPASYYPGSLPSRQ